MRPPRRVRAATLCCLPAAWLWATSAVAARNRDVDELLAIPFADLLQVNAGGYRDDGLADDDADMLGMDQHAALDPHMQP